MDPRKVTLLDRLQAAVAGEPHYRVAEYLNNSLVELVSVQREYGIYGGAAGSHLLALLRDLRMPIVATLHTILAEPDPQQRLAMDELARLCTRLIVMDGARLLREVHDVPEAKIDVIPHGIPSLPSASDCRLCLCWREKLASPRQPRRHKEETTR